MLREAGLTTADVLPGQGRLVVVSNRVPQAPSLANDQRARDRPVGGLVSALGPAMTGQSGLWFGWSGRTSPRRPDPTLDVSSFGSVSMATVDLSDDDISLYYTGFSNRTLWPLLHSFPERVFIRSETHRAYRRVNRRFAESLYPLLRPDDLVWVHDYHLFYLVRELREMGWRGRTGFFLHVPFPASDIFSILPWAPELLAALSSYDLVGVQTERYLHNLSDTICTQLGTSVSDRVVAYEGGSTRLGVYPIGIEPDIFTEAAQQPSRGLAESLSISDTPGHRIILGVDRLDYTKGIPERLRTFERLLDQHPSLRGNVTLVQISSPSRTRVPEYRQEKERIEGLVGQINGRYSEGGWVPIRYLYRTYPHFELARLYRDADVCMVTPLRDGMNLVAKEFVASQRDRPGVLVLSKFSGAASSMTEALLVNPYDIDGTADALNQALRMPLPERRTRWEALSKKVFEETAVAWGNRFRADLAGS